MTLRAIFFTPQFKRFFAALFLMAASALFSVSSAQAATITVYGTVYSNEGSSGYDCNSNNLTVQVKVNGAGSYSTTCTSSGGNYSVSSVTANAGDVITVFLDNETPDATTVTKTDVSSSLGYVDLYQNYVIVRHDDAGPLTNTNLGQYDSDNDADINFTSNSGVLTVTNSNTLYVWPGRVFAPGGNVTTPNLKVVGTMDAGSNTITVSGSGTPFVVTGTFNANTSTVQYTSTTATNITNTTYYNLSLVPTNAVTYTLGTASTQTIRTDGTFLMDRNGGSGTFTITADTYDPALDIRGDLTIASDATYTKGSGTTTLRKGSTQTIADSNGTAQDLGALQISASTATTWCNDNSGVTCTSSWTHRRKVTFNNSASTQNLTDFPALIALSSANIDYSKTQNSGQDIRFVDPSDNTTVLAHEIEEWNESGTSYVWVKVPQIDSGSTTDYVWMYYNNVGASDGQAATSVWDSSMVGVWHLKETGNGTNDEYADSSTNDNDGQGGSGTSGDTPARVTGKIAYGQNMNGDHIKVPDAASLDNPSATVTMSTWHYKTTSDQSDFGCIFSRATDGGGDQYMINLNSSSSDEYQMQLTTSSQVTAQDGASTGDLNQWVHLAAVYNGSTAKLYRNGVEIASQAKTGSIPASAENLNFGGDDNGGATVSHFSIGYMDEPHLSSSARSIDWIRAEYLSQSGLMNSFSAEETSASSTNTTTNLGGNVRVTSLTLDASQTFSQGASYNLTTTGSGTVITVNSGATWSNLGTGDISLTGNVTNSGTITLDGSGAGCGGADAIAITGGGVARNWSGAGTYTLADLTVSDTGTTAQVALSSTVGSNNIWTLQSSCGGSVIVSATGTQTSSMAIPSTNQSVGGTFVFTEDTVSSSAPTWAAKSAWNVTSNSDGDNPVLADLDNDGDIDLLMGGDSGVTYGYQNTGSVTSPTWTAQSGWNVPDVGQYAEPAIGDLDNDGDFDLLIGNVDGISYAYENTGSASSPAWTAKSAWNVPDIGTEGAPALADLDGDGDLDLLTGEYDGGGAIVVGYENTGSATSPTWTSKSTWNAPATGGTFARPALYDLDNDGDFDLLIGDYINGIVYAYENTGSVTSPTWTAKSAWNSADVGDRASPFLADLDNDGDPDMLIGLTSGDNTLGYENTGTYKYVKSITLAENGTVNGQTNLDNIKLYYEHDVSSPYNCASESYAGTEKRFGATDTDGFSGANGTSAFTGRAGLTTASALCMYAVLDVGSGASNGQTVELEVTNPSTDVTVNTGTVSPGTTVALSGTTTLAGYEIAGRIYTDDGSSALNCSTSRTVGIRVNGGSATTVECSNTPANGSYSFSGVTVAAGNVITVFLDGETEKAVTVTRALDGTTNITNLDLYQNRVIVRHEDAGPITNTNLNQFDNACNSGTGDTDVQFCVDNGNLSLSSGNKLIVWTGDTFTPGGSISTYPSANSANPDGDVLIQSSAVLSMGVNPLSVGGDFTNSGTLTLTTGQESFFTASSTGHVIDNGTGNFKSLSLVGGGGAWSFNDASNTIDQDLIIQAGTLTAPSSLTVAGSFENYGTFTHNSGTLTLTGAGNFTLNPGASSLYNLILDNASGYWTLGGDTTVANDLTMTAGTLSGSANLTVNGGDITGNGTILLTGSGTYFYGVKEMSAAEDNVCAITNSGKLYCWGAAAMGGLGDNQTSTNRSSPVQVLKGAATGPDTDGTYLINIKTIAGGNYHNCAVSNSGKTYCWGEATNGRLGDGQTSTSRLTPVLVLKGAATGVDTDGTYLINIKELDAGTEQTCALSNSGKTYCWGSDTDGRLGNGATTGDQSTPNLVLAGAATGADSDGTNLVNIKRIDTFRYHACAVSNSGKTYCWGDATGGGLGDNQTTTDRTTPVLVLKGAATGSDTDGTYLTNIKEIATGHEYSCAISYSGKTYCWGDGGAGKVGDGTGANRSTPVLVVKGAATGADTDGTNLINLRSIALSGWVTCGVSNLGKTYCWGQAVNGQLGDNQTSTDRLSPVRVEDGAATGADTDGTYLVNIKAITAGNGHECAASYSGKTYCWGLGTEGRLGDGQTTTNRTTPVLVLKGATAETAITRLDAAGNFSGDTAWSFYGLTFGDGTGTTTSTATGTGGVTVENTLIVAANQTFDAASKTITLTGSGTPLTVTGTFTPNASTVNYIGSSATNVTATTYNNMGVGTTSDTAAAVTYTLASGTTTVGGNLTIGHASSTNADTLTANTNDSTLDVNNDVTITAKGTLVGDGSTGGVKAMTVGGSWTMNTGGTFTHNSGTVTLNADGTATSKTLGGTAGTTFGTLTLDAGTDTYTLAVNTTVATALNLTNGTLDQGATFNLTSGTVTVAAGGIWNNIGTGDITLSGDVSNAGTITLDGSGAGCGGADDIAITGGGVARNWSGAGTFTLQDLTVSDTGTTAQMALSSTVGSNNVWTLHSACGGSITVSAAGTQTTNMNVPSTDQSVGGTFVFTEGTITTSSPTWAAQAGWNTPNFDGEMRPAFADLDNDGDLDMIIGDGAHAESLDAYENTGTAANPVWTAKVAWDGPQIAAPEPAFADLDNDGDFDLMIGEWTGAGTAKAYAYENTGTVSSPTWTVKSSWDLPSTSTNLNSPAFADLDGDGDIDVVVGTGNGQLYGYKNTGTVSSPTWTYESSWNLPNLYGEWLLPTLGDLDSDGDFDLIVGRLTTGDSKAFKNTGTVTSPTWTATSAWDLPDVGDAAKPALADLDNDGDMDVVIGEYGSVGYAYKNNGLYSVVKGVTISETGTVNGQTNLDNIKLYYEHDVSSPYNCASESYAGTEKRFGAIDTDGFSAANGNSSFTNRAGVTTTSTLCVYAVIDVGSGAAGGETVELEINTPATQIIVNPNTTVGPGSVIALSGTTTLIVGITIQGRIYTDEGTTALNCGTSRTVAIRVNGGSATTVECSNTPANGSFSFSSVVVAQYDVLTVYLDNETEDATVITKAADTSSAISNLDLYQNHVIVRTEAAASPMTILNLNAWDYGNEASADIQFTATDASPDTLVVNSGHTLYLMGANTVFTPGGTVTASGPYKQVNGTFNSGANSISTDNGFTLTNGTFNATTGTMDMTHDFTISGGTFTHNSGTIELHEGGTAALNIGSATLFNVVFDPSYGAIFNITGTMDINGDLTVNDNSLLYLNTGTMKVAGNVELYNTNTVSGTAIVELDGTGAQTLDGNTGAEITYIKINKSLGTLTLAGSMYFSLGWEWVQGTVDAGTSTVNLGCGQTGLPKTLNSGSMSFNHLVLANGCYDGSNLTITGTVDVNGDLTFRNETSSGNLIGGTITVAGNITSNDPTFLNSTATAITLDGSGAQNITVGTNELPDGDITIAKSSGAATLAANLTLNGTNQDILVTQGTFDTGGFALAGPASGVLNISNGATFQMTGASSYPTGFGTFTYGATSTTKYLQSSDKTVASATYGHLEIDTDNDGAAAARTFTLASGTTTVVGNLTIGNSSSTNADTLTAITNNSILDVNEDVTITAKGTLVADDTQAFTVGGGWTMNTGGTFTHSSGTVTLNADGTATSKTIGGTATTTFNAVTINAGTDTYTLAVNTIFSGAFNLTNGTLDQGATFNLTSGTVTIASGGIWNNIGTGDLTLSGDLSNAGSITLDGSGAGCGGADAITLTSTNTTNRTWSGAGTFVLRDLTVSEMSHATSMTAVSSTDGGGGGTNVNWTIQSTCGVVVSGRIYTDDGTSALNCGTSRTVAIRVNGASAQTVECSNAPSNGSYQFPAVFPSAGNVVTIFLDGETEKGAVITRAADNSSDITSLDLYQNRVIVRHEDAGPITNANLNQFDNACNSGTGDSDVQFCVDNGNMSVSDGSKLIVWTGDTFTPGGPVSTSFSTDGTDSVIDGDLTIQSSATLSMGTNYLTIGGDYDNAGTFSKSAGQLTNFIAQSTGFTITQSGSGNFDNLTFDGGGGGWTLPSNYTVGGDLTITAGTITSSSGTLTVTGNFYNRGTFTHNSGTVLMSGTGLFTLNSGGSSLNNLTFNNASGTWTLEGDTTVLGNLTMTAGSLTGSSNLNVTGNTTGDGTINMIGSTTNLYGMNGSTSKNEGSANCYLSNAGKVYCWGYGTEGSLGNGTWTATQATPVIVQDGVATSPDSDGTNLTNIKQLAVGSLHTCALANSGKVYCWGWGNTGQLGDGAASGTNTPVLVQDGNATGPDTDGTNLINIKQIASGSYNSCALSNSGKTYCWGNQDSGALGNGQTTGAFLAAVLVQDGVATGPDSDGTNLINIKTITVGEHRTFAISNSGKTYAWGDSANGALGDGQSTTDQSTPVLVQDGAATGSDTDGTYLINMKYISVSTYTTCGLSTSGNTYCWGRDYNGALGNGATTGDQNTPNLVLKGAAVAADNDGTNLTNIKQIYAEAENGCAVSNAGNMYCWGGSAWGANGNDNEFSGDDKPLRVHDGVAVGSSESDGTNLINIKSGYAFGAGACVVAYSGRTYCWGIGQSGELGDGTSGGGNYAVAPVLVLKGASTEDQTFTPNGTGNLGGDTDWTFYKGTFAGTTTATGTGGLTFGNVLTINNTKSFDAASKIITLSGSGTPFVVTGTFTPNASTVNYIGSAATNVAATTYYNMGVGTTSDTGSAVTYTLASGTTTVGGSLTVGHASSTNADTLTANTNNSTLDVNNDVTITAKGTLVADGTTSGFQPFTVGGGWTMNTGGTFTHNSGTVTFNADGTATSKTIGGTATTTFNAVTLDAGTDTYTLAVITIFSGAFNLTNGTFDQGATFNFTSGAVTVASGGIWNNIGTGDSTLSGNVSNAGTITLDGSGAGCGGSDAITLTSTNTTNRTWSGAGTFTLNDLTISEMSHATSITAYSSTDGGGGGTNVNWTINAGCGTTFSGVIYLENGSTPLDCSVGGARTVRIKVGGAGSFSYDCTQNTGAYTISGLTISVNSNVMVFLDGETEKAATFFVAGDSSDKSDMDLYVNHAIIRSSGGGTYATQADIDQYDNTQDTDIPFQSAGSSGSNLVIADGYKFLIWANSEYNNNGGQVTTSPSADGTDSNVDGDVEIRTGGTWTTGGSSVSIGGDFLNSGTYSYSAGQITTFTATASGHTVNDGASNFSVVNFNGSGGEWTLGSDLTTQGASTTALRVQAGTLKNGGFALSGAGATDTLQVDNGAFFEMSGSSVYPTNFSTYTYGATSTVRFLQTSTTSIPVATYGHLTLAAAGTAAHRLGTGASQTITVAGNLIIGDGTNVVTVDQDFNDTLISTGGNVTVNANAVFTYSPTLNESFILTKSGTQVFTDNTTPKQRLGDIGYSAGISTTLQLGSSLRIGATNLFEGGHALDLNGSNTLTLGAMPIDAGTFTPSTGTIEYVGFGEVGYQAQITAVTYNNLSIIPDGTETYSNYILGRATSQTIRVDGTFTIGNGSFSHTIDDTTQDPAWDIRGDLVINANTAITKGSGTKTFKKGSAQTWTDNTSGQDLGTVTVAVNGGNTTLNLAGSPKATATTINNSQTLALGSATFTTSTLNNSGASSVINGNTGTIILTGTGTPFTNSGTFTANSSTVRFSGTGTQTLAGSTTFYNLQATTTTARTVQFTAGATQTIATGGSVTFTGADSQLLTLASTTPGTEWNLQADNAIAAQTIQYVSVSDSNAGPFATYAEMVAADGTSTDGGNNTNWDFGNKANGFLTWF